jgi:hypothetical protein
MTVPQVFDRSVCFGYSTRVFSVARDAGTRTTARTRKTKEIQEVINPARISTFGQLKQEAFRECRAVGTKMELLNVWVVPSECQDRLSNALLGIHHRWDEFMLNELVPNFSNWVHSYAAENPDQANDILRLAPSLADVQRNTRFAFASFSLRDANLKAMNLDKELEGLSGQVLREVAAEIRDAHMDESQSFTQAARGVLSRIDRKCRGLGFLHPRLEEASAALSTLMQRLPHSGRITGVDALAVRTVLDALLDPSTFVRKGFGVDEPEEVVQPADLLDEDASTSAIQPVPGQRDAAVAASIDFDGW